jgi:Fe-S-cluster containining protein
MSEMACRSGCAACCIAPSISSAIPGMPNGKPAGMRCVQLDENQQCLLFGLPQRPLVCASLKPSQAMCGDIREQALHFLQQLEQLTIPS